MPYTLNSKRYSKSTVNYLMPLTACKPIEKYNRSYTVLSHYGTHKYSLFEIVRKLGITWVRHIRENKKEQNERNENTSVPS